MLKTIKFISSKIKRYRIFGIFIFTYKKHSLVFFIKSILEKNNFICTLSDSRLHQNPDIDNLVCINQRYAKYI